MHNKLTNMYGAAIARHGCLPNEEITVVWLIRNILAHDLPGQKSCCQTP